jgi:hypothetical protein
MNRRHKRLMLALPIALLPLAMTAASGTACELAVDLNPQLDAAVSDVLDCSICADVAADANYDAPDVSVYGVQPVDAGSDAGSRDGGSKDAGSKDATVTAHD